MEYNIVMNKVNGVRYSAVTADPAIAQIIAAFFEKYESHTYDKGQVLLQASDEPTGIIYIVSGKVKQYDVTDQGDEVILNVLKTPAFFPMAYAINRTANEYFYEADSVIEVRTAPTDEVVVFLKANPDVVYDLLARVYRGTDGLLRRMSQLMSGTAYSRVIHELIIECRRFGQSAGEGYRVDLNESDIAERAGLSRESVNRAMKQLKSEGLIAIKAGVIEIIDFQRLERVFGHEF